MKNRGFMETNFLFVLAIGILIGLVFAPLFMRPPDFNRTTRVQKAHTDLDYLTNAPVIKNEGLVSPTIDGYARDNIISIWHQGPRHLNPITIEHWGKLDGIIRIEEDEYHVTIKRSPNFEWNQIFHPEQYVPGWQWKKD